MINVIRKYLKEKLGVAAVEFSLMAPLMIFLVIGTVDIGYYVVERMEVQNTAHAVAEYTALAQDDTDIAVVAEQVYSRDINNLQIESEFSCQCEDGVKAQCPLSCDASDYQRRFIEINVSSTFSPIFPYPGVPHEVDLTGYARMRVD